MTARPIVGVVVLSALLASAAESSAQSLGDIARREAERRGTAPAAGKTFTNDNLTPDFTKPEPPPAPATEAAKPAEGAGAGKADGAKAGESAGESVVDVASDPAEAAKWGVTPRDQQTSSQNDDQNEAVLAHDCGGAQGPAHGGGRANRRITRHARRYTEGCPGERARDRGTGLREGTGQPEVRQSGLDTVRGPRPAARHP